MEDNKNNKKMNVVAEILKLRCGDRISVREDLNGCAFDTTNVPLLSDVRCILRSFFTNADKIVRDMSLFGYYGISAIYLNEAKFRKKVDTDLLLMSVKASDTDKVNELLSAF